MAQTMHVVASMPIVNTFKLKHRLPPKSTLEVWKKDVHCQVITCGKQTRTSQETSAPWQKVIPVVKRRETMPKSANPESTPKRWSQPFSLNVQAYAHKPKCCTLRSPRPPKPSEAQFLKYLARLAPKDPRGYIGFI